MATNDEQGLGWLAESLGWERSLSRLRRAADVTADVTEVLPPEPAPAPADTAARTERTDAVAPSRRAPVRAGRATEIGGGDTRPRRVHVDGGLPTSA